MSFDGIVVKSLVAELREKLIDTKIDIGGRGEF